MHIVYSSSDSYCEIAGISMLSLLENNREAPQIRLYLIDNQISAENKARIEKLVAGYGRSLAYLTPPDVEKRAGMPIAVGRWNISTFYRLFLPSMLPKTVDRALYLDCDTLVRHSLLPLWERDMGGKWVCGADDFRGAAYRTDLGLPEKAPYINNGVLLIDVAALRKNQAEERFVQFIRAHRGDITYVDQGVQNGVLGALERVGILHPKYNCLTAFFDFDYQSLLRLRRPPSPGDEKQYLEAVEDPVIVHFQSCFRSGVRPWVKGCRHPFAPAYLQYKAMSPWKDAPLRKDDRTAAQKLLHTAACCMPEKAMVRAVSVLHTAVYPLLRGVRQRIKQLGTGERTR